jgi:ketosteroid isomerase-like protein
MSIDSEHRRLCHTLLDALEQGDIAGVDACYAPDMTMWANISGQEMSRADNLAVLEEGRKMLRRRTYNDRVVNTFDDGFMAQYTVNAVGHDGSRRALWACLVAEVREGKITKLWDYLDSAKFSR